MCTWNKCPCQHWMTSVIRQMNSELVCGTPTLLRATKWPAKCPPTYLQSTYYIRAASTCYVFSLDKQLRAKNQESPHVSKIRTHAKPDSPRATMKLFRTILSLAHFLLSAALGNLVGTRRICIGTVRLSNGLSGPALIETSTDGGDWIVIQRH